MSKVYGFNQEGVKQVIAATRRVLNDGGGDPAGPRKGRGQEQQAQTALVSITSAVDLTGTERRWNGTAYETGEKTWSSTTAWGALLNPLNITIADSDVVTVMRIQSGQWVIVGGSSMLSSLEADLTARGNNDTYLVTSTGAAFDETLDDTNDYRGRHIESWIDVYATGDSVSITPDDTRVRCAIAADVDLAASSPYTVYVESTDGSLHVRASAAAAEALVWVRASGAGNCAPDSCPCVSWPPDSWPCGGLAEEYNVSNNLESPHDSTMVVVYDTCAGGWFEWRVKADAGTVTAVATACRWEGDILEYRVNGGAWFDSPLGGRCDVYLLYGKWIIRSLSGDGHGEKATGQTPAGTFAGSSPADDYLYGATVTEATP